MTTMCDSDWHTDTCPRCGNEAPADPEALIRMSSTETLVGELARRRRRATEQEIEDLLRDKSLEEILTLVDEGAVGSDDARAFLKRLGVLRA